MGEGELFVWVNKLFTLHQPTDLARHRENVSLQSFSLTLAEFISRHESH